MFCSKCGKEMQDNAAFCPNCGNRVGETAAAKVVPEIKVMLDPSEVVPAKKPVDSSKSFSGQGKTFGLILMLVSIIGDLVAMFAIGFDAFIPITIGATVLFVVKSKFAAKLRRVLKR